MAAIVFGIIAVAWLAYLLPWLLKHRGQTVETSVDAVDSFAESMVIVRRSEAAETGQAAQEVSTPLLRHAARADIAIQARTAVRRRRIGLIIGLVVTLAGAVAPLVWPLPWWVAGLGPVMVVIWAVVAHASVGIVNRRLDHDLAALEHGWDEQTTVIAAPATPLAGGATGARNEFSVDLSVPLALGTPLAHPVPIVPATYVNTPLPPRSVRTVDLAAPLPRRLPPAFPVSASFPQDALPLGLEAAVEETTESTFRRAVGE